MERRRQRGSDETQKEVEAGTNRTLVSAQSPIGLGPQEKGYQKALKRVKSDSLNYLLCYSMI